MSSVEGEQTGRAFAVCRMAMQGAALGGAALGGAALGGAALGGVIGPGWVLAAEAAAFAIAVALRSFLDVSHVPPREPGGRDARRSPGGLAGVRGPAVAVGHRRTVLARERSRRAADAVYGPLVARNHLGGAGAWGLALGFFGAGTAVGALLMTRWKPRRPLLAGTLCVFPPALPSAAPAVPVAVGVLCVTTFVAGATV